MTLCTSRQIFFLFFFFLFIFHGRRKHCWHGIDDGHIPNQFVFVIDMNRGRVINVAFLDFLIEFVERYDVVLLAFFRALQEKERIPLESYLGRRA